MFGRQFETIWANLTNTSSSNGLGETTRRSRLFLSLLVALLPTVTLVVALLILLTPMRLVGLMVGGAVGVGLLAIYMLARTQYLEIAAWLAVFSIVTTGFVGYIMNPGESVSLAFVVLGLYLSAQLLTLRTTFLLAFFSVTGVILIILIDGRQNLIGMVGFMMVSAVMFVIAKWLAEQELDQAERTGLLLLSQERQMLEQQVKQEQALSFAKLIQNSSHELKTPLSIIQQNAYVLQRLAADDHQKESADVIANQAEAMRDLINDLFVLSRLEGGTGLSLAPGNLRTVIESVDRKVRPMSEKRNLKLKLDLETVPSVALNESEMRRAIVNLLTNAIRYTPPGGAITIKLRRQNDHAVVTVSDTGVGISKEDLPRIFERFYRKGQSGSGTATDQGGAGLGLAIVKEIVEAHDGEIKVESQPDKGSTFKVMLPIRET